MIIMAKRANGSRYPLVGRTRLGNGKLLKLRTISENAQTPPCPVHALLDAFTDVIIPGNQPIDVLSIMLPILVSENTSIIPVTSSKI